jgi:hypothetical protein
MKSWWTTTAGLFWAIVGIPAIVLVGGALVVLSVVPRPQAEAQTSTRSMPTPTVVTAPATPLAPPGFGPGVYRVGVDIEPGTYRTTGEPTGRFKWCYWARLSSADGDLDAIIANDGRRAGQSVATIKVTDKLFETSGCSTWERV